MNLAIYTERRDLFVVAVEDRSDDEFTRYRLTVLRAIRNDPSHCNQYLDGDVFDVNWSKTIPGASAYCGFDLDFIEGYWLVMEAEQ